MINNIALFISFFFTKILIAQNRLVTDTIYGTENKNTSLFFPSPIKKAITGSENFIIGYNEDTPTTIGIFKASPGPESNMLIITENGNVFSFVVRYKNDIVKTNYFITNDMAVGNEKSNSKQSEKNDSEKSGNEIKQDDPENVMEKISKEEIAKAKSFNRIYGTSNKILIQLKNVRYFNNDLYFTIILKNNSTLNYEINYLNFYINSQNKKKNATSQSISYKYKYSYNLPKKIEAGETIQTVFVFDKFTINNKKFLLIELSEINGERDVYLEIPNTFINNPN